MARPENSFLAEHITLLNQILAASSDHIYVYDRAGRYQYASPAGLAALGLQASDVSGKHWRELNFPAAVMERHDAQRESVFETGVPITGETSFPTRDGVRYYEYVIAPIRDGDGAIAAVINTSRDITERKQTEDALHQLTEDLEARIVARTEELTALNQSLQGEIAERQKAEQALRESEARFQALVEAIFEGVVVQENGRLIDANPGFAKMFGYSLEEIMGKAITDLLTPESVAIAQQRIANQQEDPYEITGIRKDGSLINLEVVGKQSLFQGRRVRVSAARDITERKRAEAERIRLLEQEQAARQEVEYLLKQLETERYRLEQVLQQMPVGVSIAAAPTGQLLFHNDEAVRLLRHPLRESDTYQGYAQYGAIEADGEPYRPEEYPIARSLLTGEIVRGEEMHYRRGDGTRTVFSVSAAPILDLKGNVVSAVSTFDDVSDRKRLEAERQHAEQELQSVYDSLNVALAAANMGTWDLDLINDTARRNLRHDQIFGYDTLQPEWGHAVARRHALPEDLPNFDEGFQSGLETGDVQFEARILWPDQSLHWINVVGRVYNDDQRQPVRMAGVVMDISERKRAEAELRQSEELYRAIAHNFPNGAVHIFDHDLRYLLSDGEEMRRLGLSKDRLEGQTPATALPPETAAALEPCYRAALAGEANTTELAFADQTYQLYTVPLRNEQGEIYAGLSMSQNVTLLKQAEQTLRTSRDELERQVQARTQELRVTNELLQLREREFRTLVENTPDVITRHDRQHRCVYINPASTQALGRPPDFFIGKTPSELGYPPDLEQLWHTSLDRVFTTGQMRIDEFTVMGENGPLSYQVYVVPEKNADQSITSVMTIGRDVTQVKQSAESARQLAAELQRSNQELEQFAYIASHDLQEPLRAIASFTQLLAKRYQGQLDAKADTYIEFIVDGATRMQQLIRDLLAYSRAGRHELKPQPIDCNALLERIQRDLQITIAENAATITADPLPTVTADPTQFGNLLQNLISNSLKYRSELPPQIHVSAQKELLRSEDSDTAELSSPSQPNVSEEWVFSIQDNGIGLEPQYAERIFGIFQRLHTREEYPGTGLGLAICRKIIERHGGRIWVESQLGQGSTFFFTLPMSPELNHDNPPPTAANSSG